MPSIYPQGVFESVVEAIGEADSRLGGTVYTFLATQLEPTATTIVVDSTQDFAAPGSVEIDGEVIAIASKTATTLVAQTRDPGAVACPPGTIVFDADDSWSSMSQARSQMRMDRAEGAYLRDILNNYGLPSPAAFGDDQLRAFGHFCAHVAAGPLKVIAQALDAVLAGPALYGTISSATELTLDVALTWPLVNRRCIKILTPPAAAGTYRIRAINGLVATLEPAAGQWWRSGVGLDVAPATWECLPFDVWEHPLEPGKFHVDVLRFDTFVGVPGAAFLNGGELATSSTTTTITTAWPINNVLGVYLAGDVDRLGTNYAVGASFLGSVITLVIPLPAANTPVIVDYGSIASSANLLMGPSIDGVDYYPFYLTDPGAYVTPILDVVRAAGFLPVLALVVV